MILLEIFLRVLAKSRPENKREIIVSVLCCIVYRNRPTCMSTYQPADLGSGFRYVFLAFFSPRLSLS